jgi:hypothetical protein
MCAAKKPCTRRIASACEAGSSPVIGAHAARDGAMRCEAVEPSARRRRGRDRNEPAAAVQEDHRRHRLVGRPSLASKAGKRTVSCAAALPMTASCTSKASIQRMAGMVADWLDAV